MVEQRMTVAVPPIWVRWKDPTQGGLRLDDGGCARQHVPLGADAISSGMGVSQRHE